MVRYKPKTHDLKLNPIIVCLCFAALLKVKGLIHIQISVLKIALGHNTKYPYFCKNTYENKKVSHFACK